MADARVTQKDDGMIYRTARMSLAIKICTGVFFAITLGFLIAALYVQWMWLVFAALALTGAICYLLTPVRYEVSDDRLTIYTHIGSRKFGPVVHYSRVSSSFGFGLRLFGDGGVFAGLGFYWSSRYGFFRAYVTSARREDMVLVETEKQKVLISPENPQMLLETPVEP